MADYIPNTLRFEADRSVVENIFSAISGFDEEGYYQPILFQSITPMPEELNIDSSNQMRYGYCIYKTFAEKYIASHPDCDILKLSIEEEAAYCATTFAHLTIGEMARIKPLWRLGRKAYHNELKYGCRTWYRWRMQHWGTKWDAHPARREAGSDTVYFTTANNAPTPITRKLSRLYPDVTITHSFETSDFFVTVRYRAGKEVSREVIKR